MAPNFIRSKHQVYRLTHFLCIPITTPLSRPLLEQSLHQLRNDPCTSTIPADAYRPLQTLHIAIEVFSLPTASRVADACRHLRSLDINGLLQQTSKRALNNTHGVRQEQQNTLLVNQGSRPSVSENDTGSSSLTVTLSGIRSNSGGDQSTSDSGPKGWSLRTSYIDSNPLLGLLLGEIRNSFHAAGFQVPGFRPGNFGHVKLLSTMHASSRPRTSIRSHIQPGKLQQERPPLFETREINQKFENFVFAENIRLERLSLCELGLLKAIEKFGAEAQLTEVCSVPLP